MTSKPKKLTPDEIAQFAGALREATQAGAYELFPLGQDVASYMRVKRKRLTPASQRSYENSLRAFIRYFPDLELQDFEPPAGIGLLEEFLDARYGSASPGTYNVNLSILRDFFKFQLIRDRIQRDPTLSIERASPSQPYRTTFSPQQRLAIIAACDDLRDRIALRLLLDYALRKGALKAVQFKHFDHCRRRLTIFTKGQRVREIPLPDDGLWQEVKDYVRRADSQPDHYLMCRQRMVPVGRPNAQGKRESEFRRFPDKPMADHGLHAWWYRQLTAAGVVPEGTTSGERMHKARHTAGQRLLDHTGNLKAVQKLLGHASISTTADVYVDWDLEQLATSLADTLAQQPAVRTGPDL